ncbi:DUF4124 domain-containing protein [Marinobacter sp.]|uniref:DUF4124 domain-containing protein n=1 Tax=Marinobacter sp. TaxID=50741 RepID=UPI00384C947C
MNRPVKASLFVSLASALLISTAVDARMYRYMDENGQLVISNTVPSEASSRGYEILNEKGWVVETIDPAPTQEELAERAAAEERARQQALQQQEDAKLLRRFSHPDEAVKAMYRKLQEMQSLNQLKRGNIAVLVNQLDEVQSRAADLERSGREIPQTTLEKIDRLQNQVREIEREIVVQNAEISAVRKVFYEDIRRLENITGKERTLPLDPAKADMADSD